MRGDQEIMFCSSRCRDEWEQTMATNQFEEMAVTATLPALGAFVATVGMDKALKDYSKEEVEGLIRTAVLTWRAKLTEIMDLNDEVPF